MPIDDVGVLGSPRFTLHLTVHAGHAEVQRGDRRGNPLMPSRGGDDGDPGLLRQRLDLGVRLREDHAVPDHQQRALRALDQPRRPRGLRLPKDPRGSRPGSVTDPARQRGETWEAPGVVVAPRHSVFWFCTSFGTSINTGPGPPPTGADGDRVGHDVRPARSRPGT